MSLCGQIRRCQRADTLFLFAHPHIDCYFQQEAINTSLARVEKKVDDVSKDVNYLLENGTGIIDDVVQQAIDSAVDGLQTELISSQTVALAPVKSRVEQNSQALDGIDEVKETLANVAEDVVYLLSHSENVTACAANTSQHVGDGTCAPVVTTCPLPTAPEGGTVVVSNPRSVS